MGIVLIPLGITLTNIFDESYKPLGTVLIAVGGLFFIIGMKKKRDHDEKNK